MFWKNESEMDDKAGTMAYSLIKAVRESRNLRENLKALLKIIKKINVCIALKPIRYSHSWLHPTATSSLKIYKYKISNYQAGYKNFISQTE